MKHSSLWLLRAAFAIAMAAVAVPSQDASTTFRFRAATEAELQAVSLRSGGALVVEAVPAAVTEIKAGDMLAFADSIALLSLDDLKGAVKSADGKAVDLLFYRDGKADLATLVLKPEMLDAPKGKPAEKPVEKVVEKVVEKPGEPTQPVAATAATKFVAEQWTFLPTKASGAILAEGGMRLRFGKGEGDPHTATRRDKLRGDFELVVHYEMVDWQPAKMLSSGFGVRLESTAGWQGERLVTLDRTADRRTDRVVAAAGNQEESNLSEQPQGHRGFLRVRRKGDTWWCATRDEQSKADEWTEVGELSAKLSPEVVLWFTAHGVGAGETKVLVRDVAIGKTAK